MMLLTPSRTSAWVGQRIGIIGQLIDEEQRGIPGADVTIVATSGVLSAPTDGLELQRGATVRMVTEPGGIVRFNLLPPLAPPLTREAENALEAELSQLGDPSSQPAEIAPRIAELAASYRREPNGELRNAIDRLSDQYCTEGQPTALDWALETTTVLVIEETRDRPRLAGTVTLFLRNWLSLFIIAIEREVGGDQRLGTALAGLEVDETAPDRTARGLLAATQALAGLEKGVLAQRARGRIPSEPVARFLVNLGDDASPELIANSFQAAGAATAPAMEAAETAETLSETLGTRRRVDAVQVERLGSRLDQLETKAADRSALDALRLDLIAQSDSKLAPIQQKMQALEADRPSRADFSALESRLAQRFNVEIGTAVADVRRGMEGSIVGMRQEFETKVRAVEASGMTRTELVELENRLSERFRNDLGRTVTELKSGFETKFGGIRQEFDGKLQSKADQAAVAGLNQSVLTLQTENRRVNTRLEGFDVRFRDPGRGPNR